MKPAMYREAALKHLAMSERLDTAVQIVNPAAALVVAAAFVIIGTSMIWALVGHVPSRVYGDGLLLRQGTIVDVPSMADGQVQRIAVSVGDRVNESDVIAYIDQPDLKKQQSGLQAKAEELIAKFEKLAELDEQGRELKKVVFRQQHASASFALSETKKQLIFYETKLDADRALLDKGLTTPSAVAETRQRLLELNVAINGHRAEERNIAFNVLDTVRTLAERRYDLAMQVSENNRALEELTKRIDTQSVVRARTSGRVIELKVADGDAVTRGRALVTLEAAPAAHDALVAEIYVNAQDGKRVSPGMPIRLAPSVIRPEEDGYLLGEVESVSPFPVSEQSILRTVRNESLVTELLKSGPVYEARVRVGDDPATPSGLRWSNGRGPAMQVASGTPVHGLVTVRTRRPIELVLPAVARLVTDTNQKAD
jgi:HlyD family secretion protein